MARDINGIATRDDVNSLGVQKFTATEPDGEPLNRCVPKSLLEDDWHYSISGTYASNQLLKFQDISRVTIPDPEPEPDMGDCIVDYTVPVLISNTGNPGSQYIAENGSGVLKVKFQYNIFVNSTGLRYPLDTEYFYPAPLTDVTLPNNTYFDAWIENGDTLCVSAKTNNIGNDEINVNASLSVYCSGPYGVCSDGFGYTITQIGKRSIFRSQNLHVVYYDSNVNVRPGATNIQANGDGFARIVADIVELTGKTGYDETTYVPYTTHADYYCKPGYAPGETNTDWFTIDGEAKVVTAPFRGRSTGGEKSARFYGSHDLHNGAFEICDGYVTIRQEANAYERREETTGYDQIQMYSNYGTLLSYTGTSESQYYVTGGEGRSDTSRTMIAPDLIQGFRHYTYYEGYTARIESGVYESSGTTSGWTSMTNIEVPSEYQSFASTRVVHVYDGNGYLVEPTQIDAMQPRLIVNQNNSSSKRYFSVNVWAASQYEANPYKHSLQLAQYEVMRTTTEPKIASIGICDGTYPYSAVTSVPASYSGDGHTLFVTARCENTITTFVDGRTIVDTQEYTGRTTNSDIAKAFLVVESAPTFTIQNWTQSSDLTPLSGEMLRRDFGSGFALAGKIYPTTVNNGPYDSRNTFAVLYQESGAQDYSSVTVTHLAPGSGDLSFTISPTTRRIDERTGSYSFTIGGSTGASWYTASDVSWLHPVRTTSTNISCSVDANTDTGTNNRVGHVYVKWNDGSDVEHTMAEATVTQEPDYYFSFTGNTPDTISSAETSFVVIFVSRKGENRINIVNEWVYPESVRDMIVSNTVNAQNWQILSFNCGANPYTSERSWTVQIYQPRRSGDTMFSTTITQQAKDNTPTEIPYNFLNPTWISLGSSMYSIGFSNQHTSRPIQVTKFWYFKPSAPNIFYVYSGSPFVIPPASSAGSSVTFNSSDPYQVVMESTGDHRIECYWND